MSTKSNLVLKNAGVTQEEIDKFPIIPLYTNLVVKEHKAEMVGLIHVPESSQESEAATFEGHVIAVGAEVRACKVGDHVYFARYSGAYIPRLGDLEQKKFRLMPEEDLLGLVKEDC